MSARYDLELIRERLPMLEVAEREGMEFKRAGANWTGTCFNCTSRRGFTVHGNRPHHGHCYACGWDGDIFQLWSDVRGIPFKDAVPQLAGLAGLAPLASGIEFKRKPVQHRPATLEESGKPWLPPMRLLRPAEKQQLAELRGLSVAAVEAAERFHRVGFSYYPLDKETRQECSTSCASWVVTDPERWVAQWRRLNGKPYYHDEGPRSLSTKNTSWPLGAAQAAEHECVMIVEGGADMLAAYNFLAELNLLERVGVCAILGSSNNICEEARVHFSGKRVRIFADNDPPKERVTTKGTFVTRPGLAAAARWEYQLQSIAASVDVVDLSVVPGVKDLNDLARADLSEFDVPALFDF